MSYKMFNKDLICKDFQYEVGKTYKLPENKKLELCTNGFHYCENPLDCLDYYPLLDNDCNINPMCEITPLGPIETKGNKSVTNKIKIGAKLNLEQIINASFKFIKENIKEPETDEKVVATSGDWSQVATSGDYNQVATSGDYNQVATSGYFSNIATSGDSSKVANSGDSSQVATSGDWSQVATSGDYNQVATSGYFSNIATSGDYSKVANSGNHSKVATSGDSSQISTSGDYSKITATGKNSIIANIGREGIAKGVKGTWITLAEYKYYERKDIYIPMYVKSFKVDGKKVKENTFYKLENKKLVEVKEEK